MKKIIVLAAMTLLRGNTLFAMEAQKAEGLGSYLSGLPQELRMHIVSLSLQSGIADEYRLLKKIVVGSNICSLALSPDGKTVLTGSADKIARLWDISTGNQLQQFAGHTVSVFSVAFSPDGETVLTSSYDTTARLWNIETGKQIKEFRHKGGGVNSVTFSPDGETVLTCSSDGTARLWNVETGEDLRLFTGIDSVRFSLDGNTIALGSSDGDLYIFRRGIQLKRGTAHFPGMKQEAYNMFKQKGLYHILSKGSTETSKESQSS